MTKLTNDQQKLVTSIRDLVVTGCENENYFSSRGTLSLNKTFL